MQIAWRVKWRDAIQVNEKGWKFRLGAHELNARWFMKGNIKYDYKRKKWKPSSLLVAGISCQNKPP